nr:N-acetylglucosamine-6-sulfatase-like isoform X2 [Onthophagus taurus]
MLGFIVFCGLLLSIECGDPNFVFILTDDQDLLLNGLLPMRSTRKLVADEGITFTNAFVNTPICCPSRSTILTGKYIHNLQVFNNSLSGNCASNFWQKKHEKHSVANLLKTNKNYTTFYAGKYLNQYGNDRSGGLKHVPVGYDWWIGLKGNSVYYNYSLSINGTKKSFRDEYLTDVLSDYSIEFLNQRKDPFFMMIAPPACHSPFQPAPRHIGAFKGTKALKTPNFNYSSHDKHWIVEMNPNYLPTNITSLDRIQQLRMETLLSVDEMVERLIKKLIDLKILNETYIIFTSDNGFHIGQFTQPWDKRQPYETDVKVPFFIKGPKIRSKSLENRPISTIDVLPTILDLASIEIPGDIDGVSFKQYLFNPGDSKKPFFDDKNMNDYVFLEYFGEGGESVDENCFISSPRDVAECSLENWCKCQDSKNNTFTCVKIFGKYEDFKYCQFKDDLGFIEAYDLMLDPYELKNVYTQLKTDQINYYNHLLNRFKNKIN